MFKNRIQIAALAAALIALPFAGQAATEAELIATLKSNADRYAKADACRQLTVVGGKQAVPALAELLVNPELSHMARYALEPNPDPAVNPALRDALAKTTGALKIGVISSLGVRKDAQAVPALGKLLADTDLGVAQAAARALGEIATPAAVSAIEAALATTAPANQVAFCEGLFRAAETLAANKKTADALKIYARLRGLAGAPHQVRAGALRGAILNSPAKPAETLLLEGIRSDDYILTAAAARTAMEMKGGNVSKLLADELPKLNADKQLLVMQVLGKRGDAAAYPALFAATKSGTKNLRIAAIKTLPEIGQPAAVPELVALLSDAEVGAAALEALAGFPGKEADAAVVKLMGATDPAQKVQAIDLAAQRRMTQAIPALAQAAQDSDAKVRTTALKRLGDLGGPAEVGVLVDLLLKTTGSPELAALEQGLITICNATGNADESADKLIAAMAKAQSAQKSTLLRILGGVGGAKALQAVRGAVADADPQVHSDAIRVLGDWKTTDVADVLLDIARTSTKATDKVLSLRSYLKLADAVPAAQKMTMCKAAEPLITRDEERRSLLGVLSKAGMEALPMITPYLDNAGTKDEACSAVVTLAERAIRPGRTAVAGAAARLEEPLKKVVATTENADLKKRAQDLLNAGKDGK
jgi:HEAT repeat protein